MAGRTGRVAAGVLPRHQPNTSGGWETGRVDAAQSRMMASSIRRLRQMTLDEASWRSRELAATLRDRVLFRVRRPEWPRTCESSIASQVAARLREGRSRCVIDPLLAGSVSQEVTQHW